MKSNSHAETTRREFLKTTSALAVTTIAAPYILKGTSEGEILRVGLIGCGGRGTGAAKQALKADKAVVLTALGDVFEEQITRCLQTL